MTPAASTPRTGASRLEDRVELSDHARFLTRLRQLPEVRHDLVDQVRAAIEQGAYETPEKLDAAIDRLLQEL